MAFPTFARGSDDYTATVIATALASILVVIILVKSILLQSRRKLRLGEGDHIVVTGGSSGIGKEIAKLCYATGANVTLIARSIPKLKSAAKEIESYSDSSTGKVDILSLDLSSKDFGKTAKKIEELVSARGAPKILFNVAGTSSAATFLDTPIEEFDRLIDINYLGSAYATKAFLPHMIKSNATNKSKSQIVLTSSAAGQIGVFGYTAYSASKFAVRGFGEVLNQECYNDGIGVTVAYPPDTDTPGFAEENKSKPEETRLISESAGLFTAENVAGKMVRSACNGDNLVYWGVEGWMLSMSTAGMSACDNLFDFSSQVLLNGLLRFIGLFYLADFRRIIRGVWRKRKNETGSEVKN